MAKSKMNMWRTLAFWLVIIGALNWGLIGLANFNFVSWIVGSVPGAVKVAYLAVGLSGAYMLYEHKM